MTNDDTLRTDLAKLADGLDPDDMVFTGWVIDKIRALLAAHPAEVVSDTRREDVARALCGHRLATGDFPDGPTSWEDLPESWREEWLEVADAVLAVLPAPPVVNQAPLGARCQCGHPSSVHEQGAGCLHGWTWDKEGIAPIVDGCRCQWAHASSPTAAARLRGAARG